MTEVPGPEELLPLSEVAALMRVTEAQVTRLIHAQANPLRAVRVGRYIRIPRSSYDAYVAWLLED